MNLTRIKLALMSERKIFTGIMSVRKISAGKIILVFMMFNLYSSLIQANPKDAVLKVSPEHCVALLQGQACYVTVELFWQTQDDGNYCLFSSQGERPLKCWQNNSSGEYSQEFVANENIHFSLRHLESQQELVNAILKMAWVHKKKGKPRGSWRAF